MTDPRHHAPHEPALAQAVEATVAQTQPTPSRRPELREWIRGIAAVIMIVGSVTTTAGTPVGVWLFVLLLGAALFAVGEAAKPRTSRWILGSAITVLLAGLIATGVGLLSIPWAAGALATGSLLGWWGARLETVGESLTWTPGGDDLRYRDAGGTLDEAEGVAIIVSPVESDAGEVGAAAAQVAELGELRDVLAWLAFETGTSGRIAVDDLSDHQRLVLALAVRAYATHRGPTLPTPPAPSSTTLPA